MGRPLEKTASSFGEDVLDCSAPILLCSRSLASLVCSESPALRAMFSRKLKWMMRNKLEQRSISPLFRFPGPREQTIMIGDGEVSNPVTNGLDVRQFKPHQCSSV